MSSLEKLLIRGIRSFDPKEPCIIDFYSPLTLIVGHNGSGKTTIIECLKYATTGELPPNSKQGAFVHDPKLSNEVEIKAQVKLKFRNTKRQEMVCTRSIQVTQKAKQVQQKTLEAVLESYDPTTNQRISLSTRCADLDAELPLHLGISTAILDNVIFCHQEESNWPLSEPSVLKKKFDEIFASTRYTKALEHLRSLKKEREAELKADVAWLKQKEDNYHRAELLSNQKESTHQRIVTLENEIQQLNHQLEEGEKEMEHLITQVSAMEQFNQELIVLGEKKKSVIQGLKEFENKLSKNSSLKETEEEELESMLLQMKQQLEHQGPLHYQLENDKTTIQRTLLQVRLTLQKKLTDKGRLEKEQETFQHMIVQRQQLIQASTLFLNVDFKHLNCSEDHFLHWLQSTHRHATEVFTKLQTEMDERHTSYREKVNEHNTKLASMITQRIHLESLVSKYSLKKENLKKERDALERQHPSLDILQHTIQEAETLLNAKTKQLEECQQKKRVNDFETQAAHISHELQKLNSLLAISRGTSEKQFLIHSKTSQLKEKKTQLEKLTTSLKAAYPHLDSNVSLDLLLQQITHSKEDIIQLQEKNNQLCTELHDKTKQLDFLQSRISMELEEIHTLQQDIQRLRVSDPLIEFNPQDVSSLEDQEQRVTKLLSDLKYQQALKSTVEEMGKQSTDQQSCQLCCTPLTSSEALKKLTENVQTLISTLPTYIEKVELQLEKETDTLTKLKQLQPKRLMLNQYKSKLTLLQASTLNDQLAQMTQLRDSLNEQQSQMTSQLETAQSNLSLLTTFHQLLKEVNDLDAECLALRSELSQPDEINPEDLRLKVTQLSERDQQIRKDSAEENELLQRLFTELATLQSNLNTHRTQSLELQANQSKRNALTTEWMEIEKELETLNTNLNTLNEKNDTCERSLKELTKEFEQVKQKDIEKLQQGRSRVDKLKSFVDQCLHFNQQLDDLSKTNVTSSLDSLNKEFDDLNLELASYEKQIQEIEQKIRTMQQSQSELAMKERELLDYLGYRKKQKELSALDQQIHSLLQKFQVYEQNKYTLRLKELKSKQTEVLKLHSKLLGEKGQLELNLQQIMKELTQDYSDAQKEFRNQQIKVRTSELANKDLEQYAKALDTAIMKYHTLKMEEVNKIIKDLWTQIYQGNDIETLEIRSDKETTRGLRQFSYRLVMISNGQEIEMRGRCSAGQKVLASLVIRMALAESFSLHCGILALDEPTTNLDRDNIEALAEALHSILEVRQNQPNFQLIVITHDEDFVRLIGKSEFADHYLRVFKNKNLYSMVERVPIEAL